MICEEYDAAQSALMGKLLLKGWRMLEKADAAGCPLMEEPGTGKEFSVAAGEQLQWRPILYTAL